MSFQFLIWKTLISKIVWLYIWLLLCNPLILLTSLVLYLCIIMIIFFNEFQKMMKIIFDPNQFETLTTNALWVCLISFDTYYESFRLLSLIFYEFYQLQKKSDWLSFLLGGSIYNLIIIIIPRHFLEKSQPITFWRHRINRKLSWSLETSWKR